MRIFTDLARYRYLRSTYLHAFAGGASETRFKERLGDLFHEGYLDRPEAQWQSANCRHVPAIYELGRGARRVLDEHGHTGDERRVLLGPGAHRQFAHSVMICDVVASIELAAAAIPALEFVPLPEILAKAPEATRRAPMPLKLPIRPDADLFVVPDALFGLRYLSGERPSYRFFALEADRGTMPVTRRTKAGSAYTAKLKDYVAAIVSGRPRIMWGVPNLLVLTVTQSARRSENIQAVAAIDDLNHPALLFKAVTDIARPCLSILEAPWSRAGARPFALHTPG